MEQDQRLCLPRADDGVSDQPPDPRVPRQGTTQEEGSDRVYPRAGAFRDGSNFGRF